MANYGSPETDAKLDNLISDALRLDNDGEYDKAISKVNEIISVLDILDSEKPDGHLDKIMLRSTQRDRRLYIKILEIKKKQLDFENRIDNLSFKVQKLDKILNDKVTDR